MSDHKGNITISRVTSNQASSYIRICIQDKGSGILFLEAEMSVEAFALAITGQGHMPCEFELRGTENVGKVRETKRELIRAGDEFFPSRGLVAADELLAPFEVDGWKGSVADMQNTNCRVRQGEEVFQRVLFTRFVEAEP